MSEKFEILLLHHNRELASAVLLEFEQSIVNNNNSNLARIPNNNNNNNNNNNRNRNRNSNSNNVTFHVLQSKPMITQLISDCTIVHRDICEIIVAFMDPSLKILQSYESKYQSSIKMNVILIIKQLFVEFNHESLVTFASKNFLPKHHLFPKCMIHLFDAFETDALINNHKNTNNYANANTNANTNTNTNTNHNRNINNINRKNHADVIDTDSDSDSDNDNDNDNKRENKKETKNGLNEISNIYRFSTRFFSSIFDSCHHIHLFVSQKYVFKHEFDRFALSGNGNGNHQKILNLASFSCSKLTSLSIGYLLTCIYDINGRQIPMQRRLLQQKMRLKTNVIREIRSVLSPLMLNDERVIELFEFMLKNKKYRYLQSSHNLLRTSYTKVR